MYVCISVCAYMYEDVAEKNEVKLRVIIPLYFTGWVAVMGEARHQLISC